MSALPSIFQRCEPRPEILAGELPDAIFAADLWDVVTGKGHADYLDPEQFFKGTHPTDNLRLLVKDVTERLAGVEGSAPVYHLETGFGGGKTHSLIAAVHAARLGEGLANLLSDYRIERFPLANDVRIAAFVGEESDPLSGNVHLVEGQGVRTYTPWGQLALLAGGLKGFDLVRENDLHGVVPARGALSEALGDKPVLILVDELTLYMARAYNLPVEHQRHRVNSQWATFLQTLFKIAEQRPQTVALLTLPSEQDGNRKLLGELKQHIAIVLDRMGELQQTAARNARNLTPTQPYERAAVMGRRLFRSIDASSANDVAQVYASYYAEQHAAGVQIDSRAFDAEYLDQMRAGYPFHPELIRLFAERLADIPEFQATRGALRLVGRTIRAAWDHKHELKDAFLLQPHHVDLASSDIRDEILARLGRGAFERGLEADVIRPGGGTHASQVEAGWPWRGATESALVTFLHSLPDSSRGITPSEVALAVGRPGCDLAYVARALKETERLAWYMRREGEHYIFCTRASINKRFQERLAQIQPGEVKECLDGWVQEAYSGFKALQIIPFPQDHTAIPDSSDRIRLVLIHYDKECGTVGRGEHLTFATKLFTKAGVNESPRRYRNNIVFLLAESTRVVALKDAARALIAWERVKADLEMELARRGASGVSAELMALESDLGEAVEKLGPQELNVRSKLLEAYRVLAFPKGNGDKELGLFASMIQGPLLECFRVDFGERPESKGRRRRNMREAVAEGPILQCLRENNKLVPQASPESPLVLAPDVLRRPPLWREGERRISTEDVWERLRREPELPMVLRQAELLPTFRAGLTTTPDALWTYYNQPDGMVFNRENAQSLSPVISTDHFLYDIPAAVADRIVPPVNLTSQEVWDHLWPRQGLDPLPSVSTRRLGDRARGYFPVLPDQSVLWRAMQDGLRENRWVLYLRGPQQAIGAQEMAEWPGHPRLDEHTELWTYQAALEQGFYPRQRGQPADVALNAESLRSRCWSGGADRMMTEEIERHARGVWKGLSRSRLEAIFSSGLSSGVWSAWMTGPPETYYTRHDSPLPLINVSPSWILVDPTSPLARELDELRPGRGPQPVAYGGPPLEVMTHIWDKLKAYRDARVTELTITVSDRHTLDNTLVATWPDRPMEAQAHVSVRAAGQREVQGKGETINLSFEGRFDELRSILIPLWPFGRQGKLDVTIMVRLAFDPPVALDDKALEAYRSALMNANQGSVEVNVVAPRARRWGGA